MSTNKQKALSAALLQIEKQLGRGAVMRMGGTIEQVESALKA